jgi:hypothetical protein
MLANMRRAGSQDLPDKSLSNQFIIVRASVATAALILPMQFG